MIVQRSEVMFGKPVVAGTRITVEFILERLSQGSSVEDLLESYPRLTRAGVRAALAYAVKVLRTDVALRIRPINPES